MLNKSLFSTSYEPCFSTDQRPLKNAQESGTTATYEPASHILELADRTGLTHLLLTIMITSLALSPRIQLTRLFLSLKKSIFRKKKKEENLFLERLSNHIYFKQDNILCIP